VLALSDQALARLCLAAGRVHRRSRGPWLRRLAREIEAPTRHHGATSSRLDLSPAPAASHQLQSPSPGALYTRKWRARRKSFKVLLPVEVDEIELSATLASYFILNPTAADDRKALAEGVERLLIALCDVSPHDEEVADKIRIALLIRKRQPSNGSSLEQRCRCRPASGR
jgi:hypothetical protein